MQAHVSAGLGDDGGQIGQSFSRSKLSDLQPNDDLLADAGGAGEHQFLFQLHRPRTGKPGSQDTADGAIEQHPVGHGLAERCPGGELGVHVDRVVVTAQSGEPVEIILNKDPFDARYLPNLDVHSPLLVGAVVSVVVHHVLQCQLALEQCRQLVFVPSTKSGEGLQRLDGALLGRLVVVA